MRKACLLMIMACLMANASPAQDITPFKGLLARAQEAYRRKDYVSARERIDEAERHMAGASEIADFLRTSLKIAAAGEDHPALIKRAKAYAARYAEADDEGLWISLSDEMLKDKKNDLARMLLRAGVDLYPTSIICFRKFGEVHAKTGKLKDALAYYRELAGSAGKKSPLLATLYQAFYSRLDECSPYMNEKIRDALLPVDYRFAVTRQDLSFFIDPGRRIFESEQAYTIRNAGHESTREIRFAIHPQFIIESTAVQDAAGRPLGPSKVEFHSFDEAMGSFLAVFTARIKKDVRPGQELEFRIKCRIRPEFVLPEPRIWGFLTVSPKATYSVYPNGGARLMFGLNESSPFRMRIKYPQGSSTCAPGALVSSGKDAGYIIETYESGTPNIPTFSTAPYKRVDRRSGDLLVEFYLYEHLAFRPEIADHVLQAMELYREYFGPVGTDCSRIAASGVYNSSPVFRGGENKGNAVFLSDDRLRSMLEDKDEISVLFHELFHDHNLFHLSWQGDYGDWFTEGGANFIQAWASERILGHETARIVRKKILEDFIENEGYKASVSLGAADKSIPYGRALIYGYGALVWEQLRLKLGEDVFLAGLGDLFKKEKRPKKVGFDDLVTCWRPYTEINVKAYLGQWLDHNARVGLSIVKVETDRVDGRYASEVTIHADADGDYEIFTSLGYQTEKEGEFHLVPVHVSKKGMAKIRFESDREPLLIQLDPEYRVPQMKFGDLVWEKGK